MNSRRMTSHQISNSRELLDQRTLHLTYKIFKKSGLLTLFGSVAFLLPMAAFGQSSSDFAEVRLACAAGIGQQAVDRAGAAGLRRGLSDLCITALTWAANNGRLLDPYLNRSATGEGGARLVVSRFTERASSSTGPFHSSDAPLEMWKKGELTPSLAFDAAFTKSFLEKSTASSKAVTPAEVKRVTGECLNEAQSLALCANAGRIQGALAYQTSNAFSNTNTPSTSANGPDKAQIGALADRKFQIWAQSWSWDRYLSGSAQVTGMDCSGQCKVSGQFSFNRMGAVHRIPFVAFLSSGGDAPYSIERLCYDDDSSGMRECTN